MPRAPAAAQKNIVPSRLFISYRQNVFADLADMHALGFAI